LITSPAGSVGEDAHDVGVVPPKVGVIVVMAEFRAKLYGEPEYVTVGGVPTAVTSMESAVDPVPVAFEAVTVYVTALCTAFGVPEISQVVASIERPLGSAGLVTQLVSGVDVRVGVISVISVSFTNE
jgi:hypothetical protein